MPTDFVTADNFSANATVGTADLASGISKGWLGLDIGPASAKAFAAAIKTAKTVIWNGPMGVFDFDKFSGGSKAILEAVISATQGGTTTIIGGGDTATCAKRFGGVTKVGLYLHGHIFVFQFL